MKKSKHRKLKPRRHARPNRKPVVHQVALPHEGVLRVVAPPHTIPVVIPTAKPGVVEVVPVKRAVHKGWWDYLFG